MSELDQSICTEAKLIYTNQYFISLQVLVIILNISGIIQCTFITLFIASVQVSANLNIAQLSNFYLISLSF